jgi:hypothetical protein
LRLQKRHPMFLLILQFLCRVPLKPSLYHAINLA